MDYLYVGKIVNTHGIKGELRILSDFDKKELVFKPGMKLYFGDGKEEHEIVTYRRHKDFDMVTIKGYDNINQVLIYLKMKVYVNREDLHLKDNEYVLEELVGMNVFNDNRCIGKVDEIVYNNSNVLLHVVGDKSFYIPNHSNFIKKVLVKEKEVHVSNIEGLMLWK